MLTDLLFRPDHEIFKNSVSRYMISLIDVLKEALTWDLDSPGMESFSFTYK